MRPYATALALALAAASMTSEVLAQNAQDPLSNMVGTATNVAGGVLGNSPTGTTASTSSRSRRSRTPALGTPLPANAPRQLLRLQADGYMNLPLETFQSMKRLRPPPFDWTSNGCSFGEITGPFRDSFNRACDRHDFGYQNYGRGGLALEATEGRRTRIDDRLRDDLNGICRSEHRGLTETPCLAAAQSIYAAARSMGRSWFFNNSGRPPQMPTPSVPGFNNGANQGPIPGVPIPGPGGNQGSNGLPIPGGNQGGGLPIPGVNGAGLPIPGAQQANPTQVLTAPAQVLTGGR